jgi:hypothetical protein
MIIPNRASQNKQRGRQFDMHGWCKAQKMKSFVLFVLGNTQELIEISHGKKKITYFPFDIESLIEEAHPSVVRNGVLIFIAFSNHKLAIIGDKGINELVPSNFWDSTRDVMIQLFKEGQFTAGISAAVKEAGIQLAEYFPLQEGDVNELSNKISTNE